jgi:hypothetical protein
MRRVPEDERNQGFTALHAVEEMASRSGRNGRKETVDEILDVLVSRYGMVEAVRSMRSVLS